MDSIGDAYKVFPQMIRAVKDYYMLSGITLSTKCDYEVVCMTLLSRFEKLREIITEFCNIENAAPKNGTVKRLLPHVCLYFYFICLIFNLKGLKRDGSLYFIFTRVV